MSVVIAELSSFPDARVPDLDLDTAEPAHAWIAIDPDGRVFGIAGSFRSCLELSRDCDEMVPDQIVRVPIAMARSGIYLQWVDVRVVPAPPRELTFP